MRRSGGSFAKRWNAVTRLPWRPPMKISDPDLYARLVAILDGSGKVLIQPSGSAEEPYEVEIQAEVVDNHRRDSPDAVLRLTVLFRHPLLPQWHISVPIPIEGANAGIEAAKRDRHDL